MPPKKTTLSFKEKLLPLKNILTFQLYPAFERIKGNGNNFFPTALIIVFIFYFSTFFIMGFGFTQLISIINSIIQFFLTAFFVFFLGRWFFNGKGNYKEIFSSFVYTYIIILYLIPLLPIIFLIPSSLLLLIILVLMYSFMLNVLASNILHDIKSWQSIVVIVVSYVLVFLLDKGISLLFNVSSSSYVGQAIYILR